MSELIRGTIVRLKLNGEVFEIAEVLDSGMLRISNPGLELVTSPDGVDLVETELDDLADD
jgi:hypothetical protein